MPPPNVENFRFRAWEEPLREAQSETNLERVAKKVAEAEDAIWIRLQELSTSHEEQIERAAIQRACDEMLRIKTGKLKWPLFD